MPGTPEAAAAWAAAWAAVWAAAWAAAWAAVWAAAGAAVSESCSSSVSQGALAVRRRRSGGGGGLGGVLLQQRHERAHGLVRGLLAAARAPAAHTRRRGDDVPLAATARRLVGALVLRQVVAEHAAHRRHAEGQRLLEAQVVAARADVALLLLGGGRVELGQQRAVGARIVVVAQDAAAAAAEPALLLELRGVGALLGHGLEGARLPRVAVAAVVVVGQVEAAVGLRRSVAQLLVAHRGAQRVVPLLQVVAAPSVARGRGALLRLVRAGDLRAHVPRGGGRGCAAAQRALGVAERVGRGGRVVRVGRRVGRVGRHGAQELHVGQELETRLALARRQLLLGGWSGGGGGGGGGGALGSAVGGFLPKTRFNFSRAWRLLAFFQALTWTFQAFVASRLASSSPHSLQ